MQSLIENAPDAETRKIRKQMVEKARQRIGEYLFPKLTAAVDGRHRLVDQPPVLFHVAEKGVEKMFLDGMEDYRLSLPDDRRVLFDRYRLEDFAVKVVGIGSVGTRCLVGLFSSAEGHPLFLQVKEACPSVLAPYAGRSAYENQGQRVVVGQRLMQSSSDIFLGWTQGRRGYQFFVRQLRDMKLSIPVEGASAGQLKRYARVLRDGARPRPRQVRRCGADHGYLGKSDASTRRSASSRWRTRTRRCDHSALVAAVKAGAVKALVEEDL